MSYCGYSPASQSLAFKIKRRPCGCQLPSKYSNYSEQEHPSSSPGKSCLPASSPSISKSHRPIAESYDLPPSETVVECPDSVPPELVERAKSALLKPKSRSKDLVDRRCLYKFVDVPVEVKKKFNVRLKIPVQVDLYQPKVLKKRCKKEDTEEDVGCRR